MTSGKQTLLLVLVAIATGSAIVFSRREPQPVESASDAEPRLVRRLPSANSSDAAVQHVLRADEDPGPRLPTVATGEAGSETPTEFGPSLEGGSAWPFHPAAALLDQGGPSLPAIGPELTLEPATGAEADESRPAIEPARTHVVVDGDTLGKLAARYLGSRDRYLEIFNANRQVLSKPDLLPIGAVLTIPSGEAAAVSATGSDKSSAPTQAPGAVR